LDEVHLVKNPFEEEPQLRGGQKDNSGIPLAVQDPISEGKKAKIKPREAS